MEMHDRRPRRAQTDIRLLTSLCPVIRPLPERPMVGNEVGRAARNSVLTAARRNQSSGFSGA